jgi:hypothetical protein
MLKIIGLLLGLLCLSWGVLAQENNGMFNETHFVRTEVIDFSTDTICERKQTVIKVAKNIKLLILPQVDSILLSNSTSFLGAKWQKVLPIMFWEMIPKRNQYFYFKLKFTNANLPQVFRENPYMMDCGCLQDSKLMINKSNIFTNKQDVTLDIFSYKAKYMMISNDSSFKNAKWQPYNQKMEWKLTQEQGLKKVYAKFRDRVNSLAVFATGEIILDTQAPNKYTVKFLTRKEIKKIFHKIYKNVLYLSFQAEDARLFRIGNIKDIEMEKWQTMEEFIAIEDKWGNKQTIYVQFRDSAGNTSEILQMNR